MRGLLSLLVCAAPLAAQSTDLGEGVAHYNARRWAQAHSTFERVAASHPHSAEAALWLGKTLMAENKPSEAEDWFSKAAKVEPRRGEHQLWLARAIGMQARRANALRQPFLARRMKSAVDRAIELDANDLDARELRWQYYAMAPAVLGGGEGKARDEAAEIMRRNRYRGLLVSSIAAGRARDNAGAERAFKALQAEFPDSVIPMGSYANFLVEAKRPAEAFALVDAYQKRRPNDLLALYQLGRISAVTGQQLERGEEALRRFLAAPPPPAFNVPSASNAHLRLGNIAERRGNKAAARAEYERALGLDPRNGAARRALDALK